MTLFGDAPTPRKARKPKAERAENADAVTEIEAAFLKAYQERWGLNLRRDPSDYGRDRRFFGNMEQAWGKDVVLRLIAIYFSTTDQRITRGDYSVKDFNANAQYVSQIERRKQLDRRQLDPRTAANRDAALRASGRKAHD